MLLAGAMQKREPVWSSKQKREDHLARDHMLDTSLVCLANTTETHGA